MTAKKKAKKSSEPSILNNCCNVIYHVRKMASMEGNPTRFEHHLEFAEKYLARLRQEAAGQQLVDRANGGSD